MSRSELIDSVNVSLEARDAPCRVAETSYGGLGVFATRDISCCEAERARKHAHFDADRRRGATGRRRVA